MGDILDWAKREVEIACKKEKPNRKKGEFDYGCACYVSALKAFESLTEDGHSGYSIGITKNILNRLIDGMPLTPIEDTDGIWNMSYTNDNGEMVYQCNRMSALFKTVHSDGSVDYSSNDHCYCIDINNPKITYYLGLVKRIIHKMFPIAMPYMPGKPIKVFCEDFLTDKNNGDFDTVGVFYALKEENREPIRIEINRFFREPKDNEKGNLIEISKEEYYERKNRQINNYGAD